MQTSNKKRRLDSPNDNDDDWGDDITAEEFDIMESQVTVSKNERIGQTSLNIIPNRQQFQEEQLAQEGQIRMLRESLEKKSAELNLERLEREQQISQRLKEQNRRESELKLNIDRLESALKFKQHELSSAQDKIKLLEQKSKIIPNSKGIGSIQARKQSPVKVPLNVTTNHFANNPTLKEKSVQTDTTNVTSKSLKKHSLGSNILNTSECSVFLPASKGMAKSEDRILVPPCKVAHLPELGQLSKGQAILHGNYSINATSIHLHGNKRFSEKPLPIQCHCKTQLDQLEGSPNSISEILNQIIKQLKDYVQHMKDYKHQKSSYSESDSSKSELSSSDTITRTVISQIPASSPNRIKRAEWNEIAARTALHLADLRKLLTRSNRACTLLMRSDYNGCAPFLPSDEMITLICSCTKPVFYGTGVVNQSVVDSALTALNVLSNHCNLCCIDVFSTGLSAMSLTELLNGSCPIETAYLVIKLLTACVGIRSIAIHRENSCLLKSLDKLYSLSCRRGISRALLHPFILSIINWLSALIIHSSVVSVFSDHCVCLSKVLKLVCKWLDKEYLDEKIVLKALQLLRMLTKQLSSQMRIEDCFLLILNKMRHRKLFTKSEHSVILKELCNNAKVPVGDDECVTMEY